VTSRINLKYLMLAFLMTGVAAISGWLLGSEKATPNAQQTAPQPAATPPVAVVNGVTVVTMDTATQIQNGIRAEPLTSSETPAEITAYGTVLDLQPLIDLRTRYAAGLADADTASAALSASRQEYRRSLALYQDNQNVSLKSYQAALATYRSDQARTQAAALNLQNIQAAMRQQLGATITHWALDSRSPEFSRLLNRQAVLLRITVPPGDGIAAPIRIKIDANEKRRLPAQLVSPSPQSDPVIQGSAFIYRAAAPLPSGTRIVAYLPTAKKGTPGMVVPADAIVWYGGQPWAYVQINAEQFARYPVAEQSPMQGGFFVTQGFKADQRVVVSGAQLLLSEELKPPPGGSGCKDPECDD
jgi:multidrug efflux system membrane fusion protein